MMSVSPSPSRSPERSTGAACRLLQLILCRFAAYVSPRVAGIAQHAQLRLHARDEIEQAIVVVIDELRRIASAFGARELETFFAVTEREVPAVSFRRQSRNQ